MKHPPLKILTLSVALAIFAALSFVALSSTGCGTVHSVTPVITNTNGHYGGSIEIVFTNTAGAARSVTYTAPAKPAGARGIGHSLNEARNMAVRSLKAAPGSPDANLTKLLAASGWEDEDATDALGIKHLLIVNKVDPARL